MTASRTMLVYIMGRGHSGSTVLDALIGGGKDVEGVGELISGWRRREELCSCKKTILECDYWKQVRESFEKSCGINWNEAGRKIQSQAIVSRFIHTLLCRSSNPKVRELVKINTAAAEAITQVSGKHIVIDSTKEATRALFLGRFIENTRIIHLVRHPDDILASYAKRIAEGTGFRFLRRTFHNRAFAPLYLTMTALSWMMGNLMAEAVSWVASKKVLRVRYEDLCADPVEEIKRIEAFLDVDMSPVIAAIHQGNALPIKHKIAGNRMRMAGQFRFDPTRLGARPLANKYRFISRLFCWPMLLKYGYFQNYTTTHKAKTE